MCVCVSRALVKGVALDKEESPLISVYANVHKSWVVGLEVKGHCA